MFVVVVVVHRVVLLCSSCSSYCRWIILFDVYVRINVSFKYSEYFYDNDKYFQCFERVPLSQRMMCLRMHVILMIFKGRESERKRKCFLYILMDGL